MKKGVLGLLLLFTFSYLPSLAAAPIKPGSMCSKQGITKTYKGKKYTCIKTGKRLIWNKGVVVQKPIPNLSPLPELPPSTSPVAPPSPSPSPSITSTPNSTLTPVLPFISWSTDINQESLINKASSEFKIWLLEDHGSAISPNYLIDPQLDGVDISWIRKSLDLAVKAFGKDSPSTYTVIVGKDCQWIRTVGLAPCMDSTNNQYFSNSISKGFFILQSVSDATKLRPSDLQTASHEYFHTIQSKLSRGANWPSRVPSWFIEGGANFIGVSFADLAGVSRYLDGRNEAVLQRDYQFKKYLPLSQYTYANFQPPSNYENPYGIGLIATEYIVASAGMARYLDIYRNLGLGNDFETSFEIATGIPLTIFYEKFEITRDKVGMPRGQ